MKTLFTLSAAAGLLLAAPVALGAGMASAQNASLRPNFGTASLRTGFTPDPYTVDVYAGGTIDVYTDTDLPGACVGNISDAPDFRVTYQAGRRLPLVFRTVSRGDTTLVINGPDGRWSCDDDSFGDGDAQVVFRHPQSGTYDVWVGVLGASGVQATLGVTETP
ncbi:peptidase S1 [soil metagenome]